MSRYNRICLVVSAMLMLFFVSYIISFNIASDNEDDFLIRDVPTEAVDASNDIIVSNITKLTLETYDMDSNTVKEQLCTVPIEYLGLNRAGMIETLQDYMLNPSLSDKTHGLIACELVEFTKDSVTIRKTYSTKNLPQKYYIVAEKGMLVIYLENRRTLYDKTEIELQRLPLSIQEEVIKGLEIDSADELYDFLETFTS
ncbi:MAG: hypothetical protein ACI4EJ_07100 [Bacteroides sp.]